MSFLMLENIPDTLNLYGLEGSRTFTYTEYLCQILVQQCHRTHSLMILNEMIDKNDREMSSYDFSLNKCV